MNKPTGTDRTLITLVTTILNEENSLASFLASITEQTRQPDEVIIVDGGSVDRSVATIERWASNSGLSVRVEVAQGAGISAGRNIGINSSTSEIIAVADAGTRLDPRWLEALAEQLTDEVDVVAGFFHPTGDTFFERALAFAITPTLDEIDPQSFLPSSRSVLFRRSAWAAVGGYPEWLDYCEDLVFDLALKSSGAEFVFTPAAIASWSGRPHFRAFAKTYYRYARGDGKAGLWGRRHAARYSAYTVGLALAATPSYRTPARLALCVGFMGYMRKFLIRASTRRQEHANTRDGLMGVALVFPIVVTGDFAKMLGYPVGVIWRLRNRQPHG